MSLTLEDLRRMTHALKQAYNRYSGDVSPAEKKKLLNQHISRINIYFPQNSTEWNRTGQLNSLLACVEAHRERVINK